MTVDFNKHLSALAKDRLAPSMIGDMIRMVAKNKAISFTAGEPAAELLPMEELKEAFASIYDDKGLWGYYKSNLGHEGLRAWIADRMRADGLVPSWVNDGNVLVTNGSQEAIAIFGEAFIDPGCVVVIESPSYTETILTFRKFGALCITAPMDDKGIIPEELEKILDSYNVRFIYTIPNFQNPSGATATIERRKAILEMAQKRDVLILEDDPYHYLYYDEIPPRTYISLAGDDRRVIYLGSFSKIVAPGMRCGWMVVPDEIVSKMMQIRVSINIGLPVLVQQALLAYFEKNDFSERISYLQKTYSSRRDALTSALDSYLRPLGFYGAAPAGGFFIWGGIEGIDDMPSFAKYAVEEQKIGVIPGEAFFTPEQIDKGRIRLSFAKITKEDAEEGVMRLARAVEGYRKRREKN